MEYENNYQLIICIKEIIVDYEPLTECHIKYKYQYTETHLGNVKSLFNSKIPATITKARPIDRATLFAHLQIISRAFELMSYIPAQSNFALLGTSKYPIQILRIQVRHVR